MRTVRKRFNRMPGIPGLLTFGQVLECHRVAGLDSYVLKVVSRNTEALDGLISGTLRRIAGVTRTTTTIVLATVKETTVLPLPEEPAAPKRRKEAVS